jgi:hypothetical protein
MKTVGWLVIAMFAQGTALCQRAKVTQGVEWIGTSSNVRLTHRLGFFVDGQYRFVAGLRNMQHMVRSSFDIYLNKHLSISPIGYSYIWNFRYGEQPAAFVNNEHRFYQQLQYSHSIGKFSIAHRFRSEERMIQFHSGTPPNGVNEGYHENFQFRIRHRVWANMPFRGEKVEPKSWYLASMVELFMSWGERVTYDNKIDQYRLFLAPGYQLSKHANIQVGPYYQYLVKRNGLEQENNVGVLLQLNYNFDLSKPAAN